MENVHKPHNYTAILRSCDAVGVLEAHAITSSSAAWERKRLERCRAGASAARWVGVHIHDGIIAAIQQLHQQGFSIFAAHPSADARDFRAMDYTVPTAIMVGTELDGLTPQALEAADAHICVPMLGLVESLNVSVATALILFEAQRQRQAASMYDAVQLAAATFTRTLFEWSHPQIASLCRRRGIDYPVLNEFGDVVGEFPR
jgi:tRNA (guanosine-2'-O-)-methyltransferase